MYNQLYLNVYIIIYYTNRTTEEFFRSLNIFPIYTNNDVVYGLKVYSIIYNIVLGTTENNYSYLYVDYISYTYLVTILTIYLQYIIVYIENIAKTMI